VIYQADGESAFTRAAYDAVGQLNEEAVRAKQEILALRAELDRRRKQHGTKQS
jgi:hypothetical protein